MPRYETMLGRRVERRFGWDCHGLPAEVEAALVVAAEDADVFELFVDLIRDEVNVKRVELTTDVATHGHFELAVNARACGPRLGGDTQKVIRAVKAGEWSETLDGVVVAAGIELLPEEYSRRLVATDPAGTAALPDCHGLVCWRPR